MAKISPISDEETSSWTGFPICKVGVSVLGGSDCDLNGLITRYISSRTTLCGVKGVAIVILDSGNEIFAWDIFRSDERVADVTNMPNKGCGGGASDVSDG
jgi:hypothetical protein